MQGSLSRIGGGSGSFPLWERLVNHHFFQVPPICTAVPLNNFSRESGVIQPGVCLTPDFPWQLNQKPRRTGPRGQEIGRFCVNHRSFNRISIQFRLDYDWIKSGNCWRNNWTNWWTNGWKNDWTSHWTNDWTNWAVRCVPGTGLSVDKYQRFSRMATRLAPPGRDAKLAE